MSVEPKWTDRKAKWRALHPERNRAQRDAQNENRRLARKGQSRTCERCGAPNAEVHHVQYKPTVITEVLCERCHQAVHREDGTGQASSQTKTTRMHEGGLAHHPTLDIQGGLRHRQT